MRRSNLEQCTVLIARTGKAPVTFLVQPRALLVLVLTSVLTPLLTLGFTIYSLHQRNTALTQQNNELSRTATEVIQELEVLDDEILDLRERAGMDESVSEGEAQSEEAQTRSTQSEETPSRHHSLGGVSTKLDTAELLAIAKARVPLLSAQLYGQVKPALNETLDAEEARRMARPQGRPVKGSTEMSSQFGLRRNPFGWGYEFHDGLDFTGPFGAPIHATAAGVIEKAEYQGGYGNHVLIDHGYGYKTLYAHLSEMSVAPGEAVSKGQTIGTLGNTGRSTGPHLHYSIYQDGESVNPISYIE